MNKRLLIIDDDPNVRDGLKDILEDAGWHVLSAGTIAEGLALLPQLEGKVVLVDYQLPDGSGLDLAAQLRETAPEKSVVLLTGMSAGDLDPEKIRHLADSMTKPIDPAELLRRLERLA